MTPHATSLSDHLGDTHGPGADFTSRLLSDNGDLEHSGTNRSHLRPVRENDLHDLICVGFGPASLAIATALHDALDMSKELPSLHGKPPKVAFLERQEQFQWHSGMLLEGAKMQISFLKDMATFRDPKSEFTFLNYLHKHDRLVQFTNLSTFLPQRVEYEDYMRWCASWFNDVVEYNREVIEVIPEKTANGSAQVESFLVISRDTKTRELSRRRTRHVLIAVGGKPNIPDNIPQSHPRVIHSSQYAHTVPRILKDQQFPYRVAVIGGGQSAAEIFDNLQGNYPNSRTTLLVRDAALRPSDDSPFVNEIFDACRVDDFYALDPSTRACSVAKDRNTNYGVVRLELLEKLYEHQYMQRLQYGNESDFPHRILTRRSVVKVDDSVSVKGGLRVHVRKEGSIPYADSALNQVSNDDTLEVDLVVVANGYRRDTHEEILRQMRALMPGGDQEGKKWTVARDYRVQFEHESISPDAGVWLQGCNEATHGLSDSLLSILATRGNEIVESIFGKSSGHFPGGSNGFGNGHAPYGDVEVAFNKHF